jgi:rRNA maturation endonuclease Nob1
MPNDTKHHEATCTACSKRALAKPGDPCAYCGGTMRLGAEYTRKTFGRDDNDLMKGG